MRKLLTFLLILGLAAGPVWALRPTELTQSAGAEELRRLLSTGLEEPPFGRRLRTQQDEERVEAIVREYKARSYPHARKKGSREHGTKKTLIALKMTGYYVRFYELGVRDYFVFHWEDSEKPPLILWAQGQQVGRDDSFHLPSDGVDYLRLEGILKEKLWRIYSGGHPYDRLKALSRWLEAGLSLASAVALATAKDFEVAKEFYDEFIQAGLSQVAAYVLASSAHPSQAFAHYQELIATGVSESEAYVQAVSKNHFADSGLEELQARVRRFLSGLEEQAPKARAPFVIGQSLQDQDRRFRALAGLEEYGIYLHQREGSGSDRKAHGKGCPLFSIGRIGRGGGGASPSRAASRFEV